MDQRFETDSLGRVAVPATAYYGAQTARAVANFPIGGQRFPRPFIAALGRIKEAAAAVNACGFPSPFIVSVPVSVAPS